MRTQRGKKWRESPGRPGVLTQGITEASGTIIHSTPTYSQVFFTSQQILSWLHLVSTFSVVCNQESSDKLSAQ